MKKVITMMLLSLVVVALAGSTALAAPFEAWHGTGTLYPATSANTSPGGAYVGTGAGSGAGLASDNLWTWTDWWCGADVDTLLWQVEQGEVCPTLTTTVSGLDAGDSYDVYVQYWGYPEDHVTFGVKAGISGGAMVDYVNYNDANTIDYTIAQELVEDSQCVLQAYVGTVTGATSVSVDIGTNPAAAPAPPAAIADYVRSAYVGISVSVVPEPATMLVLAIGGILSLIRRRR